MPRSLQAQITRTAISPRLAIRIFWNISARANGEKSFSVLDWPATFHEFSYDSPGNFGLDLVHQLHRFDNAENLAEFHRVAYFDEWRIAGLGRLVIGADDGRLLD